jgi:hypothetical protein
MTDTATPVPTTPSFEPADAPALLRVIEAQQLLERAGSCSHQIRLVGGRDVIDRATGLLLESTYGREITVSCDNLVVAGLRGGKATPAVVSTHPRLFVTVTAPSFGPVHLGPDKTGHTPPLPAATRRLRLPALAPAWRPANQYPDRP